jgi:multiple sugar transport system substrate-binding protein
MRKALVTSAVVTSLVALTGCASSGGGTADKGKTTISYAFWGNNDEAATIKAMIAKFEAANPDITVEANWIQSDYEQKLQTSIAGGDAPTVAQISNTSPRRCTGRPRSGTTAG